MQTRGIYIPKKEKEFYKKFWDFELMCCFTEHEMKYLKIGLLSLIHIKKAGVPISVYVNNSLYEVLALTYLRIGGEPEYIESHQAFKNVMENAYRKMKRQIEIDKEMEKITELELNF